MAPSLIPTEFQKENHGETAGWPTGLRDLASELKWLTTTQDRGETVGWPTGLKCLARGLKWLMTIPLLELGTEVLGGNDGAPSKGPSLVVLLITSTSSTQVDDVVFINTVYL